VTRLHIFDMDGTLMRGSSASMEIAREIGLVEEFRELEAALGRGGSIRRGMRCGRTSCGWR